MFKCLIGLCFLMLLGACSYPKDKKLALSLDGTLGAVQGPGYYTFAQGEWLEIPMVVTQNGQPVPNAKVTVDCVHESGKRQFKRGRQVDASGAVLIDEYISKEYDLGMYNINVLAKTSSGATIGEVNYLIKVTKN